MGIYDIKKLNEFEKYTNTLDMKESYKSKQVRTFVQLMLFENELGVVIENWTKQTLLKLCKEGCELTKEPFSQILDKYTVHQIKNLTSGICYKQNKDKRDLLGYQNIRTNLININSILDYINREDLKITISDLNLNFAKSSTNEYFSKSEIIEICDSLSNIQDRFIIYGTFSGIKGKANKELLELKEDQIDFKKNCITLTDGKEIVMDEYLKDLLIDVLDPEVGSIYVKLGSIKDKSNNQYLLNINSPYIIKCKPTVTNNNGMNPMKGQGLQTRLKTISTLVERDLLIKNIYKSGILHRMHEIKEIWSQNDMEVYLKENNYEYSSYEASKTYRLIYGDYSI